MNSTRSALEGINSSHHRPEYIKPVHETPAASKTVPAGVSKCRHATAMQVMQLDAWTSNFLDDRQELESSQ
jgi:hypothetical protein